MSEEMMSYVSFYGFWVIGIICCFVAAFGAFVVIRAIFFPRNDKDE
ncbi:hypothetical protein [Falsirhodobacter deserti]|nr:hypothetical protein [Falsirhodobacter deserti]